MSSDTYPINPALLAPVEPPRNPPVQISDEFVMPREVAIRLVVCNHITNKTRKRCKRAMQTAVVSRAPILQKMKFIGGIVPEGTSPFVGVLGHLEKADRVYNLAQVAKPAEQRFAQFAARLDMKQLLQRAKRIPAKRKMAQWVALHGRDEATRAASEQRVNVLDALLDAIETEVARRVL